MFMNQHSSAPMENQKNIELRNNEASDEAFNIRNYWQIVSERRWLALSGFIVVVLLSALYILTALPIYSSTSRLQIDRETENSLRMDSFIMNGGSREQDYLQTQYKNLQSRSLMEFVLQETIQNALILNNIADGAKSINQLISKTELTEEEVKNRLNVIAQAGFFGPVKYQGGNPPDLIREKNQPLIPGLFVFPLKPKEGESMPNPSYESLLGRVSGSISVTPIRFSRLVDVTVLSPNSNEAAMIANTIVVQFIEQDNARKRGKLSNAISFLKTEAENLNKTVLTNFMALHSFKLKWDIISLEETQNTTLQALLKAQGDYDSARSATLKAQAVANEAKRVYSETKEFGSIPEVAAQSTINSTREKLALSRAELASLAERYKEKHPKIIEKRSAINTLEESLRNAENLAYDAIINQAELADVTAKDLAELLTIRMAEQQSMNQKSIEYKSLERSATQSEAMYKLALQRLKETELQEKDIVQNMHIVDSAVAQLSPVKPRKFFMGVFGIMAGLMIGFSLAFSVHYLDDSIKSQEDIEGFLKLPFLGYIPNIKTTSIIERDMQAHLHPQSNSAEAFRTIRAAISLSNRANDLQILAVTSTIPSEGKSLVASNHAIVTAQTGAKTLLVDCDLRRPSVHKAFQIQSPRGLTSYLLGREDSIDSIAHQTEVSNLDIICCGAVPNNPSELAGSQRMLDFVAEVRDKYEKVVFDCPPVSAVSDPLIIASSADGTVFVNKFNKIRRDHARKTVQRVQDAGINIIGVCINDLDFEGKDSYYYSYYYYQNRYYASHYKSEQEGKANDEKSDIVLQPGASRKDQSNKSA